LIRHLPDPRFKLHYFWNLTSLRKTELSLNESQIKNIEWTISSVTHMNTALQWSELLLKIELGWRRQCFLGVCLMEWLDYKESAIEVQQPLSFCPPVYQEQIQTSKLHKMSENFAYLQSKSNLNTIERWLDDNKVISSEVQKLSQYFQSWSSQKELTDAMIIPL
jgi:hypothetical protein